MRKKLLSLTVILSLVVSMFMGTAQVFAAGVTDFKITPLVSDSASEHKFLINNLTGEQIHVDWLTSLDGTTRTETIPANGSVTVTCSDSQKQGLNLTVLKDGGMKTVPSLNTYQVSIVYQDTAGNVLQTLSKNSTKGAGISHTAPSTLTVGSEKYNLSGTSYQEYSYASDIKKLVFTYAKQERPAYSCPIIYVDQDGNQIGSASMEVKPNTTATFTPPSAFAGVNGRNYTLMSGEGTISHHYNSGSKEYIVRYQIVREVSTKPYLIRVLYQDSVSGALLSAQTVTVQSGKTSTFDVAKQFVTSEGVQYNRENGESAVISHDYDNAKRTYVVRFVKQEGALTEPYNVSVRYIDAASGSVLKSNSVSVGLKQTARFSVDSSFTAGDTKYLLASGQPKEITHQFGTAKRVYDVYYNEQGAGAVEQYDVTIRYFDITSNSVLYSTKKTAKLGEDLTISVPNSYSSSGNEYVLLSGQGTSVSHDFYSVRHAYVFFYRNAEDTQNEDTTVNQNPGGDTIVVTPDNTITTVTPGGTVTITDEDGDTVTIDENDIPLDDTPDESDSSETTPIEDEKVPTSKEPGQNNALIGWTIAGSAVVLLAAVACVFIILKRKKAKQPKE